MRTILVAALLTILSPALALCQETKQAPSSLLSWATNEINEGTRAYRDGKFNEAQRYFERAIKVDPSNKNAPFFLARAIHAQFRPGIDTPENVAVARSAIGAYQRLLNIDPSLDEAYNAIVYLYRQIKDEAAERQWLMARVADMQVPADKRASAYTLMASEDWNCSYTITERKEHKATVYVRRRATIKYLKPKDDAEFHQARRCAKRGMELIERAVGLDADSLQAWSYKNYLLLELVKLAEMEGNNQLKGVYQKQSAAVQQRTAKLSEQEKKKAEAQQANQPPQLR